MFPSVGTLSAGDVYPGLATPDNPAPNRMTTDEGASARELEGAGAKYAAVYVVAIAFLLFALRVLIEWKGE